MFHPLPTISVHAPARAASFCLSESLSADFLLAICKCHHTISIVGAKNVHEHLHTVSGRRYYLELAKKNHLFYLVPISYAQHFLCSSRTQKCATQNGSHLPYLRAALLAKHVNALCRIYFGRIQNRDACLHYSFGAHQRNSLFAAL